MEDDKQTRAEELKLLNLKMMEDIRLSKEKIAELMNTPLIDDDGYPTDSALEIIKLWHWTDASGWFKFIHELWHLSSWGWGEGEEDHEYLNKKVHCYHISTAGFSGNESIIRAMKENDMLWSLNWVQSRRGGHYIFELKEFEELEND